MIQVCPKCGELYPEGRVHDTDADCVAALKAKMQRLRNVGTTARFEIQRCRDKRHGGLKVHPKMGACQNCFARGYAAFAIMGEILLDPAAPQVKDN